MPGSKSRFVVVAVVALMAASLVVAPAGAVLMVPSNVATAEDPPTCDGKPATIVGTPGDDVIDGTSRSDVIHGLGGNDTINGLDGDDFICGGDGHDIINGADGAVRPGKLETRGRLSPRPASPWLRQDLWRRW